MSSIPGSVGYIGIPCSLSLRLLSGFSGYIWLDTKIMFEKSLLYQIVFDD